MSQHLSAEKEAHFPYLRKETYQVTSPETAAYNCMAFVAGREDMPWWPVEATGVFWPAGVPKEETLECFVQAFATAGYAPCDFNLEVEMGFEKIVLYVGSGNEPTHAARQLANGWWTSKLGEWEDIEHATLDALEDRANQAGYGRAVQMLKRPRGDSQLSLP